MGGRENARLQREARESCYANGLQRLQIGFVLFRVAANRLTERHSLHFDWRGYYLRGRIFSKMLGKPPCISLPGSELSVAVVDVE